MNWLLIFAWIWAAMIAMAFWESSIEGKNPWDKKKSGWKLRITKNISLTKYHFYLFFVMFPLLLTLPFVVYGWNTRLFGIIISAFFSGSIIEDFMWFLVNPHVSIKEHFNSKWANYYPWIKIGRLEIPVYYVLSLAIAILSWYFLWR